MSLALKSNRMKTFRYFGKLQFSSAIEASIRIFIYAELMALTVFVIIAKNGSPYPHRPRTQIFQVHSQVPTVFAFFPVFFGLKSKHRDGIPGAALKQL